MAPWPQVLMAGASIRPVCHPDPQCWSDTACHCRCRPSRSDSVRFLGFHRLSVGFHRLSKTFVLFGNNNADFYKGKAKNLLVHFPQTHSKVFIISKFLMYTFLSVFSNNLPLSKILSQFSQGNGLSPDVIFRALLGYWDEQMLFGIDHKITPLLYEFFHVPSNCFFLENISIQTSHRNCLTVFSPCRKFLQTYFMTICFFSCICPHANTQMTVQTKCICAQLASKRFLITTFYFIFKEFLNLFKVFIKILISFITPSPDSFSFVTDSQTLPSQSPSLQRPLHIFLCFGSLHTSVPSWFSIKSFLNSIWFSMKSFINSIWFSMKSFINSKVVFQPLAGLLSVLQPPEFHHIHIFFANFQFSIASSSVTGSTKS